MSLSIEQTNVNIDHVVVAAMSIEFRLAHQSWGINGAVGL